MTLSDAEYDEMARLLFADIHALVPLIFPHNRPVSEANIRLMAVLMRRWLVDGDLQTLLAPLRQPAHFEVLANSVAQAYPNRTGAFNYFLTAGVIMAGRPVSYIGDSPLDPAAVDRSFVKEGRASLTLKKFLAQPRLFHGGNHLDFDRSGEWERLDAANRYMRYGGPPLAEPPEGSEIYLRLEPTSDEIIGGVHLEVVAAAAAFVQMDVGGQQLCTLQSERSLIGKLRGLFRDRPKIDMVDRPRSTTPLSQP